MRINTSTRIHSIPDQAHHIQLTSLCQRRRSAAKSRRSASPTCTARAHQRTDSRTKCVMRSEASLTAVKAIHRLTGSQEFTSQLAIVPWVDPRLVRFALLAPTPAIKGNPWTDSCQTVN